jgi:hypothetical protein
MNFKDLSSLADETFTHVFTNVSINFPSDSKKVLQGESPPALRACGKHPELTDMLLLLNFCQNCIAYSNLGARTRSRPGRSSAGFP